MSLETTTSNLAPKTIVAYFQSEYYAELRQMLDNAIPLAKVDARYLAYLDRHQDPETVLLVLATACFNLAYHYGFYERKVESRFFANTVLTIVEQHGDAVKLAYVRFLVSVVLGRLPVLPRIPAISPVLELLLSPLGVLRVRQMRLVAVQVR